MLQFLKDGKLREMSAIYDKGREGQIVILGEQVNFKNCDSEEYPLSHYKYPSVFTICKKVEDKGVYYVLQDTCGKYFKLKSEDGGQYLYDIEDWIEFKFQQNNSHPNPKEERKHIGEYWSGEDYTEEIVKVGNDYFLVNHDDGKLEQLPKEKIQWSMTNPWSETNFKISFNDKDEIYTASYISVVYDGIEMVISGIGKAREEAIVNLSKSIIDIFEDYDEEHVENYMSSL